MKITEIINSIKAVPYSAFFYTPLLYESESYIFLQPEQIIEAYTFEEAAGSLKKIEKLQKSGLYGYALIPFETGYLFEKHLTNLWHSSGKPLFQFFFFNKKNFLTIHPNEFDFCDYQPEKNNYHISNYRLNTSKKEYVNSIKQIKNFIECGDTYQVNYTVKCKFNFRGDISSLFNSLIFNQSARYTAFINNKDEYIISISPELFFIQNKKKLITKPMKGTIRRGINITEDKAQRNILHYSEKDAAENIMIVDLLRNDMGRVSKYGKVRVSKFYEIEKYESLYQMTSTVESLLNKEIGISSIIQNLFPCGSVTGAPKIRTMEIINLMEKEPRGIYTGAIGLFLKNKTVFNVAIRTIGLNKELSKGEIGLGSGIVWDSNAIKEYEEVLLKSNFLIKPEKYFELYETILVEKGELFLSDYHLTRLKVSADFFLFCFDQQIINYEISNALKGISSQKKYRLKLTLNKWGQVKTELTELDELAKKVNVIISSKIISTQNKFQYFKTTNRDIYSEELNKYIKKGYWDVLFFNEKDEIAEGARTNIFIKKGKKWFTPPISTGILNGVFREYLLTKNNYFEKTLTRKDVLEADKVMLTNSLRKKIYVNKIEEL